MRPVGLCSRLVAAEIDRTVAGSGHLFDEGAGRCQVAASPAEPGRVPEETVSGCPSPAAGRGLPPVLGGP